MAPAHRPPSVIRSQRGEHSAKPEIEYQIVLTHKDKGKFASDWKVLDDTFVFANVSGLPMSTLEKIKDKIPEVKEIIDDLKEVRGAVEDITR